MLPDPIEPKVLLSRRRVLTTLSRLILIGGFFAISGHRTAAARRSYRTDAHTRQTIAAVIDRMLPTDELPGGRALGVDRRITTLTDPELKRSLATGVAWLDGQARRLGASEFLELDEARQDVVLQAALTSTAEGATVIGWRLRNLALTFYYTDPTIMAAFAYSGPPQPSGFPDYQEAPR